jgi:dihydroorotate dehydrogenase
MKVYKTLVKPLLFLFSPESAHHLVIGLLKIFFQIPGFSFSVKKFFSVRSAQLEREVFGIHFPNPVGLAAGFDKDAKLFDQLSAFGFGFIEVGTVTPRPQPGNPKPRMFRLPMDEALINRMGFNNEGVDSMLQRLKNKNPSVIIGGNIGKNKETGNEKAVDDYEICFRTLFNVVDYFVVNVSSPNTAGLRDLQEKEPLLRILKRLQEVNHELSMQQKGASVLVLKPLLLKISPDLSEEALDEVIQVCIESKLDGIIATNTTISRDNLSSSAAKVEACGNGGLSGKPLRDRSTQLIRYISTRTKGKLVIIAVGGIHSPEDALEKLEAGAALLQLYTGFIYEGPSLIKDINESIIERFKKTPVRTN